jgi:nitrogen-specific signal transduction histidine kinase
MVKARKSKFSFFRNFGWKLLILSLFIAGGAAYLLRESFYPYEFDIIESISGKLDYEFAYHDFDHDGFSETLEIRNYAANRYNILVRNWNGGTIDQANYWETMDTHGLMFADVNGDDYDEILAFTQRDDSLFFYLHDLISKKVIINRLFLECLEEPISTDRNANFFPVRIANSSFYKSKVFIFAVRSFTALKPRSVYALDLENEKIIAEFKTNSTISDAFLYDLTGDGLDEIVVVSMATGNVHYPAIYKDDKCWLFVLNQKLEPIFPPLSFSQYPAALISLPIEIYSERYLLAIPDYWGEKNLDNFIYLVNSKGKIHLRTQNPFKKTYIDYAGYKPVVSSIMNPSEIYGWQAEKQLIKLNHRLEIVKSASVPFEKPRPLTIKDINSDGEEEIFYTSKNYLLAYDEELNLLAKFPNVNRQAIIDFRETGPNNSLEISFTLPNQYYRLSLIKNKLYSYLPLILIGLTGLIFLFLNGGFKLLNRIVNRNQIFKYIRFDSSDGVMIVNHLCMIVFSNDRFAQILNLNPPPKKGDNAVSILNHYPQMLEIMKKCREIGEQVNQKILLSDDDSGFECEISVQPYKHLFKKGSHYLLILKSVNLNSHSDKIHTWSRAVQKMAHDIKTPLSTVSLNLKVLQTRLEKIRLSETEHNELSDDIKMMRTELDNIQAMTKNFLKFSNLDKPHFQAFNINTIIEEAKSKFQPYINADLSIEVSIDKDVKPVWADPQQIEMVFTILIENALAAIKGKGLISVNVSSVQYLENIFLESLEIEVADTGPGIKEEDKKRIFEPYYSTKSEGTGMGLAIAKKIIEDNGGSIEVHSKPDFGAVFRFSLPVMKEEEENE